MQQSVKGVCFSDGTTFTKSENTPQYPLPWDLINPFHSPDQCDTYEFVTWPHVRHNEIHKEMQADAEKQWLQGTCNNIII